MAALLPAALLVIAALVASTSLAGKPDCGEQCSAWCRHAFGKHQVAREFTRMVGANQYLHMCRCEHDSKVLGTCKKMSHPNPNPNGMDRKYCCEGSCPQPPCPNEPTSCPKGQVLQHPPEDAIGCRSGCHSCAPCKKPICSEPPTSCPSGTTLDPKPLDANGCEACPACVDANTGKPVATPVCFLHPVACSRPACPPGHLPVLETPKNASGHEPCCDTYMCKNPQTGLKPPSTTIFPATAKCPRVDCTSRPAPARCPKGSTLSLADPKTGCPSCATCVDFTSKQPVPVTKCDRIPFVCPEIPECKAGYRAVVKKGVDDTNCCPIHECEADPSMSIPPATCPQIKCKAWPFKCPLGSSIGQLKTTTPKGIACPGCATCVDSNDAPVPVPTCFVKKQVCAIPSCSPSERLVKTEQRGIEGGEPCCDVFKCAEGLAVAIEDVPKPSLPAGCPIGCPVAPKSCPEGTALGIPKNSTCPQCAACVEPTKHPLKTECDKNVKCSTPKCLPGANAITTVPAGQNQDSPCCPTVICEATASAEVQKEPALPQKDRQGNLASIKPEDAMVRGARRPLTKQDNRTTDESDADDSSLELLSGKVEAQGQGEERGWEGGGAHWAWQGVSNMLRLNGAASLKGDYSPETVGKNQKGLRR